MGKYTEDNFQCTRARVKYEFGFLLFALCSPAPGRVVAFPIPVVFLRASVNSRWRVTAILNVRRTGHQHRGTLRDFANDVAFSLIEPAPGGNLPANLAAAMYESALVSVSAKLYRLGERI